MKKAQLFAGPTFQNCWSFGHHSSPLNPRALPLGRLTKRPPTHTPVPPNPAVEPLAVSFLNSFFCYELDNFININIKSNTLSIDLHLVGGRWLHDDTTLDSAVEAIEREKRSKEGWRICTVCAPLNIYPFYGKGWESPPAPRAGRGACSCARVDRALFLESSWKLVSSLSKLSEHRRALATHARGARVGRVALQRISATERVDSCGITSWI